MKRYVNVQISGSNGYDFDWDRIIDEVLAEKGMESDSSGAGAHFRDLSFVTPRAETTDSLKELHGLLTDALPEFLKIAVSYEAWDDDFENVDGPAEEIFYPLAA